MNWTRQHSWLSAQGMCRPASCCFHQHLQHLLSSAVIPTCLETISIVPVPKKSAVSCLNDCRSIVLTNTVMKCFERLVIRHLKRPCYHPDLTRCCLYIIPKCSSDNAAATTHLDKKDMYIQCCTTCSIRHSHCSTPHWKAKPAGCEHLPLSRMPPHWALATLRAVCSALCWSPCWLMNVQQCTASTTSSWPTIWP